MKKLILAAALAAPFAVHAEVGGFVEGGLATVSGQETDPPFKVELDDGLGINLAGGLRWSPGFMVKIAYSMSEHDGGEISSGNLRANFDDEVTAEELRIGFFWAPLHEETVGFRIGGGYENTLIEIDSFGESETDGVFVEGALLVRAGDVVTFDFGGALIKTEDEDNNDTDGVEFRIGAKFHLGPVDLGVAYRHLEFSTDVDGTDVDDEFDELRVTIGGSWGWGRRK